MKSELSTPRECVRELIAELSEEERRELRTIPHGEHSLPHFGLGMQIRNRYLYPIASSPLMRTLRQLNFIAQADLISPVMVEMVWLSLKDAACTPSEIRSLLARCFVLVPDGLSDADLSELFGWE